MNDTFLPTLRKLIDLNEQEEKDLLAVFTPLSFKKGDFLVKEGEVCNQIIFILDGYFRVYVLNDIEEQTIHLASPGTFCSCFSSFITQTPAFECVQALKDSQALSVTHQDLQNLYESNQKFERLGRLIIQHLFVQKEKRVIDFIKHPADKRYLQLMEEHPDFLQEIPLQIIASFLGIKPETLSRIRSKKL